MFVYICVYKYKKYAQYTDIYYLNTFILEFGYFYFKNSSDFLISVYVHH